MSVVGARPNFMKIASIIDAINQYNNSITNSKLRIQHLLVHTGQHYNDSMSEAFFRDLVLPRPDIYLGVGSGTHAAQTADIMKRFEPVLLEHRPDVVIVVGDVNSTAACALVASKINYSNNSFNRSLINQKISRPLIAHVEAGLRSFDRTMPEEINRIVTDALSDYLFTSEKSGNQNLLCEGISRKKIFFVGNTMIDTLLKHREKARHSKILEKLNLLNSQFTTYHSNPISYSVLTLHRPSNVDNKKTFEGILRALKKVAKHLPIIFPAHPRTVNRIKEFGFKNYFRFNSVSGTQPSCIYNVEPLGYLDFLSLISSAKLVITDSGGIQEETTILGVPCVTLRENTERPVTIVQGTNTIAGTNPMKIVEECVNALNRDRSKKRFPAFWDGKAGDRIVSILAQGISKTK